MTYAPQLCHAKSYDLFLSYHVCLHFPYPYNRLMLDFKFNQTDLKTYCMKMIYKLLFKISFLLFVFEGKDRLLWIQSVDVELDFGLKVKLYKIYKVCKFVSSKKCKLFDLKVKGNIEDNFKNIFILETCSN